MRLPFADVGHLTIAGSTVAVASYREREGEVSDIAVLDLDIGASRVVAESAWSGGNAGWPEIVGDWVVYVDRYGVPDASAPGLRWAVRAINRVTSEHVLVSSSNGEDLQSAPAPLSRDGYVVWSESIDRSDPSKGLRAYLWKPDGSASA